MIGGHREQCGLWQVQSVPRPHFEAGDMRPVALTFSCHPQTLHPHPVHLRTPAALPLQPLLATPAPVPCTAWLPS